MSNGPIRGPWKNRPRPGRCRRCAVFAILLVFSVACNVVQYLAFGSQVSKQRDATDLEIAVWKKKADDADFDCNTEKGRWNATVDRIVRRAQDAIDANELGQAVILMDEYAQAVDHLSPNDHRRFTVFLDMMDKWHAARKERTQ